MTLFDEANYPTAMTDLPEDVRSHAIAEANARIEEGYPPGPAASIGIAKAQETKERGALGIGGNSEMGPIYNVLWVAPKWAIWPVTSSQPTHHFGDYEEALRRGTELAMRSRSAVYAFDSQGRLLERSEEFGDGKGESEVIQVKKTDGHWEIKSEGEQALSKELETKQEALDLARRMAQERGLRFVIQYSEQAD